jgi:hypothetical protein
MMAAEEVAPAQIQEVLGTELEVDQEYYVEKQFRIARSNGEQTWHTQEKYSAIYYGPFEHNQGGFIAKQIYRGRAIVNKMYYHPLTYSTDQNTNEENRTRFYKKTDTQKNQKMRDNLQKKEALAQTYEQLDIHQYYGNDGQPQFSKGPDGKSYLGDGGRRKRTLCRASKSKKRRSAARSKKRRARTNKHKKTRRTKR